MQSFLHAMFGPFFDYFFDLCSLFRSLFPVILCLAIFSVIVILIFKNGSSPLALFSESNQGADESPLE